MSRPNASGSGATDWSSKARIGAIAVVSVVGGLFHMYVLGVRPIPPSILRPIHLCMVCSLAALWFPFSKKNPRLSAVMRVVDALLIGTLIASTVYIIKNQDAWLLRAGFSPTKLDIIFGWVTVFTVLEMTRRAAEWPLSAIGIVFLAYALCGHLLPGILRIPMYTPSKIISHLYSMEGLFGMIAGVSATYIYPFIILGAILNASGTGEFFLDFATSIAGGSRGGPAKVAVISSALFGTVSGSAAANVVATGTFTIPLMIASGYPRHFAGAVEATASTGGQIMPPIMAAGAFLLAEMLGKPYGEICMAALIPAVLYFFAIFLAIDSVAMRLGLGASTDQVEKKRTLDVIKERGYMIIPLFVVVYYLMVLKQSPIRAGLMAIIAGIIVSWFRADTRMGPKKICDALVSAGKGLLSVGLACAIAGIVVGILTLTGLGTTISSAILAVAGNSTFLALVMTMIVALILGMGLPTTGAYVICAAVCAPALIKMGVTPIAAHMFVFYFATINAITPPVALAAYAASGIAQESSMKIGVESIKLGIVAFIVPYMFVYGNQLLMIGSAAEIAQSVVTALVGVTCIVASVRGYIFGRSIGAITRVLAIAAGLALVHTGTTTDIAALVLIGAAYIVERLRTKAKRTADSSV